MSNVTRQIPLFVHNIFTVRAPLTFPILVAVFVSYNFGYSAEPGVEPQKKPVLSIKDETEAFGGRRINLGIDGHAAFIILPKILSGAVPMQWVWYAPTFQGSLPSPRHSFIIQRVLKAGMAFAGVDAGESYGNAGGTALYTAFHDALTEHFQLSPKAVLLPQSRGGLMLYNWAAMHAEQVERIAGIYTVCDLQSYPGLKTAAAAYHLSEAQMAVELPRHNPIDLLAPLVMAKVPILHIHGDSDKLVPMEKNSAELARRYRALGGSMELLVVPGKGHEEADEFFTSERFVVFLTTGK